jgi:hypothetical protein
VADTTGYGVHVVDGASLALSDALLESCRAPDASPASALTAGSGSRVTASRVRVRDTEYTGIIATDAATTLALSDSVIGPITVAPNRPGAYGLAVGADGSVEASRVTLVAASTNAIQVVGAGARLALADAVVRGTSVERGLDVAAGAGATVARTRFERLGYYGVQVHGAGSVAELADVLVRDVGAGLAIGGSAVIARDAGRLRGAGVVVHRAAGRGVLASRGGTAELTDAVIADVGTVADGVLGYGVCVTANSAAALERVAVVRVAGLALGAIGLVEGSARLSVLDAYVAGVSSARVAFDPDSGVIDPGAAPVAYAVHATGGSEVRASRFVIANGGYGFSNLGGALALTDGVVTAQLDAAGAVHADADRAQTSLVRVTLAGNTRDGVVRDATLPAAASLAVPTQPCVAAACE